MSNYPPNIYDHETRAFRALMAEVDAASIQDLQRALKFALDDLYGDGEGTPESPRTIDPEKEWDGETAYEIRQSLNLITTDPVSETEDDHECTETTPDPATAAADPDDDARARCASCGILFEA